MSMDALPCAFAPEAQQPPIGLTSAASATLTGDAIRLMLHVDRITPIYNLADRFPHIVNKLAELWKRPYYADRYFDELLHDIRGSHGGFPLVVLNEISDLYAHYRTKVFPLRQDAWSKALYA
jgi:hypothetical protein